MSGVVIGIDVGTSGARCVALDADGDLVSQHVTPLASFGTDHRRPAIWAAAVEESLGGCLGSMDPRRLRAIAVDGTSGTVLAVDQTGTPLAVPSMYNDAVDDAALV